jgi:hypothetical protein
MERGANTDSNRAKRQGRRTVSSSNLQAGGGSIVADDNEVADLTPPRISDDKERRVDLREAFGFVGYVTGPALAEIARNESRACRVVTTAATFAFR